LLDSNVTGRQFARVRKVSMLDVARETGVSKNTVSLALRNDPQIPLHTRQLVQKAAAKLGYCKNPTVSHLMAQLRAGASTAHKATLALLNANESEGALLSHPTIPTYVEGCRRRAAAQGYSLDEFWLHDPRMNGERLNEILRARGIRGVVVTGLMNTNQLPASFLPTWRRFPCVVTGVRTREPALSFACADHHILAMRAFENALRLGYRRPALVLDRVIDELVDGRFSAGVLIAQQKLPASRRTRPFHAVNEARKNFALFRRWFEKEKPDVLLTLYHDAKKWVEGLGLRVPQDIGLVQLEWRGNHPDWAGMNQHNDIVGEAAVEMVIGMIHGNEAGIPLFPRATLIGSTWVDGGTVCQRP
jgi:DNA-binding LacI/PurR family transcriptional regulator